MLARDRIVALLEIVKDRLAPIERHARSRVGNGNGERAAFPRDPQTDPAALGELDRIARNIEQDLPQARRISDHLRGTSGAMKLVISNPFACARGASSSTTLSTSGAIAKGSLTMSSLPDSIRERSSRSSISEPSDWPEVADRLDIAFLLIIDGVAVSRSAMPRMPFNGVRTSWLTVARKRDFASLAASARSRASRGANSQICHATARARVRRRACAGRSGEW